MSARKIAPQWRALVISLSVAVLVLGATPSARATTTYDELWVANDPGGSPIAPGTSCTNAGFSANDAASLATVIEQANNDATVHLCAGIYLMNEPVVPTVANIKLVGEGTAKTLVMGFRTTHFFLSSQQGACQSPG